MNSERKFLIYIFVFIVSISSILFVLNNIDDHPSELRSEYENFTKNLKINDNSYIYLVGLFDSNNKTKNRPEEIYNHGKEITEAHVKKLTNSDHSNIEPLLKVQNNTISAIYTPEDFSCIFNYQNKNSCVISLDTINQIISDNKIYLDGLVFANKYQNFSFIDSPVNLNNLVLLNQIILAKIILEVKNNNPQYAYDIWLENFKLNKDIILGENSSYSLAVALVNYNYSLKALNALAYYKPQIIEKNHNEIRNIISQVSLDNIQINKIGMVEFASFSTIINNKKYYKYFFLENNSLNKYFEFHTDFQNIAKSDWKEYPNKLKAFANKYYNKNILQMINFRNTILNFSTELYLKGVAQSVELIMQIKRMENKTKISMAIIEIIKQRIPKEKIQNFLDNNNDIYFNSINHDRLKYDDNKNSIYTKTGYESSNNKSSDNSIDEVFF